LSRRRAVDGSRWPAFDVLRGKRAADLAIVGGRVLDVHSGEVAPGGVAIAGDRIALAGDVDRLIGDSTKVIDAHGAHLTPGLIETHAHQYHSNLTPTEYARLCLRRGTTTVAEAFYGQGQVGGIAAVRSSLAELRATPLGVLFQAPILAYLQNVELGLDPTPARPSADDLIETLSWEGCVGLEEPPLIPFVERDEGILRLAAEALARGQLIMGHGAGLSAEEVAAYASLGISADHECVTAEGALERIAAGMVVSMRECAISHDQPAVQRAITELGADPRDFMLCTDVPDAVTMSRVGHLDHQIRLAVAAGIEPVDAVRMATINAARWFRVADELGSLSPGRIADVLIVDSLEDFSVRTVVAKGRLVVEDRRDLLPPVAPAEPVHSARLDRSVRAGDLRIVAPSSNGSVTARAIAGAELLSEERLVALACRDGAVMTEPGADVLKVAMVDRYGRREAPAVGLIQGYGLRRGALGTSYNPYTNNPMAVGVDDAELAHALNAVAEMGGGFVAVAGGEVLGSVELPHYGFLSGRGADDTIAELERLYRLVGELGCRIERPFHQLAFCAVGGELPRLKLSDRGLFDVEARSTVPVLVD
jgi:adenine deaminase